MSFSQADRDALSGLAGRLKVPLGSLGGLMEMESGLDPNIWGGAGGQYRGLIQFGPDARKEVGLPDRKMTVAEQVPFVEKYFQQRGFTPGKHGVTEMYRTVLVGNPHQSGTDSFGTNSDKAARRMQPGGDLYERFMKRFGGAPAGATASGGSGASAPKPAGGGGASSSGGGRGGGGGGGVIEVEPMSVSPYSSPDGGGLIKPLKIGVGGKSSDEEGFTDPSVGVIKPGKPRFAGDDSFVISLMKSLGLMGSAFS